MFTPLSSTGCRSPSLLKRSAPHALSRNGPSEVAGPQSAGGGTTLGPGANESTPRGQKPHARHLHQSQWRVSLGLHHDAHDAKLMSPRTPDAHAMRAYKWRFRAKVKNGRQARAVREDGSVVFGWRALRPTRVVFIIY